tara:strand:+ start:29 stop:484 length:456 start_codon:yes stop_codon:yes gene_type:complete
MKIKFNIIFLIISLILINSAYANNKLSLSDLGVNDLLGKGYQVINAPNHKFFVLQKDKDLIICQSSVKNSLTGTDLDQSFTRLFDMKIEILNKRFLIEIETMIDKQLNNKDGLDETIEIIDNYVDKYSELNKNLIKILLRNTLNYTSCHRP